MKYIDGIKKLLTLTGWQQFFKLLNKKEKIIFFILFASALCSSFFLLGDFYFKNTVIQPAKGGKVIEAVIGYPRFINPIYAEISDVNRDLTELIFSGLMKYDSEGNLVPDLADDYNILENGTVYEFHLKDNIYWHDGTKLTSDDVIFTIKTIQNPEIKSPLMLNWLGITAEKIDDLTIRFKLKEPNFTFLERTTVKIIPSHIWKEVLPKNFPLMLFNLQPIGSGPYQFKKLERDKKGEITSLELVANPKYFGKTPNISRILFVFFDSEEDLVKAAKRKKIDNFQLSPTTAQLVDKHKSMFQENRFLLLRYFAVFFNPQNSKPLSEKEVRQALNYGINKTEILEKILKNEGQIVHSPLLPELYHFSAPQNIYSFDPNKTEEILEKVGFVKKDGKRIKTIKKEPAFRFKNNLKLDDKGKEVEELQKCLVQQEKEVYPLEKINGVFDDLTKNAVIRFQKKYKIEKEDGKVLAKTRAKLNELCFQPQEEVIPLKFSLVTVNQPPLNDTALLLKKQWENLGAEVNVKFFDIKTLEEEVIKTRNYDALLFGESLGQIPDLFPFWHSSQMEFGLNVANYENKKVDELLEIIRKEVSFDTRKKKYEELQEVLLEDAPAVFLYNPDFLYLTSKKIKGIKTGTITDSSQRFLDIENWYIKTKRAW